MKGTETKRAPIAQRADQFARNQAVSTTHWIDLGCGICLQLKLDERGWGWHAWAESTAEGWRMLPAPAPQDVDRRFITEAQAVRFFELLMRHPLHFA